MIANKSSATMYGTQTRPALHSVQFVARSVPRRALRAVAFQGRLSDSAAKNAPMQQAENGASSSRAVRMNTIELITAAVSIQAQTQQFERFAGRSAMIGVAVAVVAELLTESSIFRHFSADTVASLGSLFMGAVSLAAAAACASKRRMGVELLEAVVTSLTANQRSAASVTGRQVDTAVDNILAKAFDQGVIYSILAEDEDI